MNGNHDVAFLMDLVMAGVYCQAVLHDMRGCGSCWVDAYVQCLV